MTGYATFEGRVAARHPGVVIQSEPRIGAANSARFLYGGLKVGVYNLETRARFKQASLDGNPWALACKILLPGDDDAELFIALIFEGADLPAIEERLVAIKQGGTRPNNVRVVLHAEGCFFTALPESESIDPSSDPTGYGKALPITAIYYADVKRDGQLTRSEIDIVQRLRKNYIDPTRVMRLDAAGVVVNPVSRPESLKIAEIQRRIDALGVEFARETIETYHLNQIHNPRKHFVILRGISGTGKSLLAKSYAYAVLGESSLDATPDRFVQVPVEPQWTDPTFLLGYEDALAQEGYRRTPFLDALIKATDDPDQPVFVLLDEMNRAQVEHYFSNFLSSMESASPIQLTSTNVHLSVPQQVPWPSNLYLVGTVNDDESVIPFSPMVLDRANTQDLSDVDVAAFVAWLKTNEKGLAPVLTDAVRDLLVALAAALAPHHLHFGRRTIREVALYMQAAQATGASINALDRQIDQKILPKLRGGEETSAMLESLGGLLASYPDSLRRVQTMQSDLQEYEFFKYR